MRSLLFLALVSAASVSSASFDLVLVGEVGVFPGFNRIHRYDGNSGTYLGAFNAGVNSIGSMAANYATGIVYVTSNNRIFGFNYSTGEQVFTSASILNPNSIKIHNGQLYAVNNLNLQAINTTTGSATTVVSAQAGQLFRDFTFLSDNSYVILDDTGARLLGFNSSNQFVSQLGLTNYSNFGYLALNGGSTNSIVAQYRNVATTTVVTQFRTSFAGGFSTPTLTLVSTAFATSSTDIEMAHDGTWWLARNSSGTLSAFRNGLAGSTMTGFAMPQITNPSAHMAVVLAPEPGTLAAIGLGLGALLKRRKTRAR